jgi:methyl-accepting chemotaxis protein
MLNQLPMTRKLLFTLVPATVAVLLTSTLFLSTAVHTETEQEVVLSTQHLAQADGERIVGALLQDLAGVRSLASVMATRKNLPAEKRRDYIGRLLNRYLADHPTLLGSWTLWEPNTFDGLDAEFAGTSGHDATGRFIPYWYRDGDKLSLEPLKDYETAGIGDYYLLAKKSQRPVILEPYKYPVGGVEKLLTSLVIPLLEDGHFVGVVGVDLLVSTLQDQVAQLHAFTGTAALFGQQGTVIAHPDAQRLGRNLKDTEIADLGEDLTAFADAVREGRSFVAHRQGNAQSGKTLLVSQPIPLGEAQGAWTLAMLLPEAAVMASADALIARVVVISVVGLALLTGLILVLSRSLAKPLRQAVAALTDIASGEGDLTNRLPVQGRDEIAQLASAFNAFADQIHDLVIQLTGVAAQLAAAAEELFATSEDADTQIQRQRGEIEQVATAMEEMATTVQEVSRHAAEAAAAAHEADRESDSGSRVVQESIKRIDDFAGEVHEAAAVIRQLETHSGSIGKVLDVIRGIAQQTNLLALNAAIEAARAGEQGRGFAVVADEVRTLASRTEVSTAEIQTMIERLQHGAEQAVQAMQHSESRSADTVTQAGRAGQSLGSIAAAIVRISDMNAQIASASEEQSAVAEEISRNLANITASVDDTSQGSRQIAAASQQLARLAAELQHRLGQFKI